MNNNLRTFWIIWCCFWALFWFFAGWFSFGLAWLGIPVSLLCILIPIGHQPGQGPSGPQQWRPGGKPWYGPSQPSQAPRTAINPPGDYGPGWKPDPWSPVALRWWDGSVWTNQTRPR